MYNCIFIFQTFKASHMPATWVGPTDQNLGEIRGIKHDQRINIQATVTTGSINRGLKHGTTNKYPSHSDYWKY